MPAVSNPLKPRNPFTGQTVSRTGVKTAAQLAAEAQARLRAAQARIAQAEGQYQYPAGSSVSTNPGGTFTDNNLYGVKRSTTPVTASGATTDAANAAFRAAVQGTGGNPAVQAAGAALSGVGGAAATGGNPAFPTGSGYTAQTQLGRSYRDLMLPSAWEDPEALIDTYYRVSGLDKGSGDYGTQLESADNLGILYMALMGENANQGNANFVDWASNYLTDQRRADGRSLAPSEIWQAIVDPSANSPLSYYLNNPTLTPEDQVNNFMSTMRYGMESTLPAPILNALMAQVDQMGREFRSLRNTQAGNSSFTEYLQSRPGSLPWGVLGGL
jgi:hypothetical protein